MTMYVVKPIEFTPSMLLSTTALEPNPQWDSTVTYSKDAQVTWPNSDGDGRIWKSLVNNNTDQPGTSEKWFDLGPCNKCAMFDSMISTQTEAMSPLIVEIVPGDIVSNLALLNIIGDSLTVEIIDGGVIVYTETLDMQATEILDWWDYYFTEDEQITQALFDGLPLFYGATIRITLTGPGPVAIGHTVFGSRVELGELSFGANSGIIDYSRKTTDEFGVTEFVRRAWADEFSGQLLVQNTQLNSIKRTFRELRSTPSLWVGCSRDEFRETLTVFGWYRSHRIAINYPNHSLLDFEIEGLT